MCYVYCPPSSRISWFDDFSVQLDQAAKHDTILLGDFNIDRMNQKYNNNTVQMYNFTQLIQECTHISDNKDIKECIIYRDRAKQKMDYNNYRIFRNKVVNMIKKSQITTLSEYYM